MDALLSKTRAHSAPHLGRLLTGTTAVFKPSPGMGLTARLLIEAFDGTSAASLAAPNQCWAADSKAPQPHWLSLRFPEPREIRSVTVRWTNYRGFDPEVEWWTSVRYDLQAWQDGEWRTVVEVTNEVPVVGLREGGILRVEGESVLLKGVAGARIFRRGQEPVEVTPVAEIGQLLG